MWRECDGIVKSLEAHDEFCLRTYVDAICCHLLPSEELAYILGCEDSLSP